MKRVLILFLFFVAAVGAYAQHTSISGTVVDATGAVVKSAPIRATQIGGGATYKTTSNAQGVYQFPVLDAATYTIKAENAGYAPVERQITLHVGQTLQVFLILRPASVSAQVSVAADEIAVDTTSSAVAGNIDPDKVANIPLNGRNYLQLASLVPGIRVNAVDDSPLPVGTITGFQLNVDGQQVTQNYAIPVAMANQNSARTLSPNFRLSPTASTQPREDPTRFRSTFKPRAGQTPRMEALSDIFAIAPSMPQIRLRKRCCPTPTNNTAELWADPSEKTSSSISDRMKGSISPTRSFWSLTALLPCSPFIRTRIQLLLKSFSPASITSSAPKTASPCAPQDLPPAIRLTAYREPTTRPTAQIATRTTMALNSITTLRAA